MATTAEEIVKGMLGEQLLAIASLRAKVELLQEQLKNTEKKEKGVK